MRAVVGFALFAPLAAYAACTPDIVSGAYVCGPEMACPDGQFCNGVEDEDAGLVADTCVLGSLARPFACTPKINLEPDDTADQGHEIANVGCVSTPFTNNDCMLAGDSADWVWFVAPMGCTTTPEVQIRLSFPISYEELSVELWDLDHDMKLATDGECKTGADASSTRRCLNVTVVPGTKYGVKVAPTGQGTCDGDCAYNRYTLNVQLATPS